MSLLRGFREEFSELNTIIQNTEDRLLTYFQENPFSKGVSRGVDSAGLMLGLSGVGYGMLQCQYGEELPSKGREQLSVAWCHGAAGILLSRSILRENGVNDPGLHTDILNALETTVKHGLGNNRSFCHGDFGQLENIENGAAWKDPHTQNYYTGFAHGTSGIAAALSRFNKVFDSQSLKKIISQCLAFEKQLYIASEKNWG
ncbi:hypothetical protein DT075_02365 [Bacillus licheniformis]|nr:hypothetical protein DT075_02365 [Bacillus licheniformis]